MKRLFLIIYSCLLFLVSYNAHSQIKPAPKNFIIQADYSRFWQKDSTSYLEIAIAVNPNMVVLKKDSAGYHGKVEINVTIKNKSTNMSVLADRFYLPVNLTDSISIRTKTSLVSNVTYILSCGSYTVAVNGHDISDGMRGDSVAFNVEISKKPKTVAVSDVELCSNISASSDQKDPFYKNTYLVIPQPNGIFGSTSSTVVFTYVELYNLDLGKTYTIDVQVVDVYGNIKKSRKHVRRSSTPDIVDVSMVNIGSIGSGKHILKVILSDTAGFEFAKTLRPVFIYNPHIQSANYTNLSLQTGAFDGLSSDELAEEFQTARYIARPDDEKIFNMLKTKESRREFLEKFWSRVEKEEQGRTNLTRAIYIQRVLTANQRYAVTGTKGWRTDRGRVYILNGEPDDVQRFPYASDTKSYEIWYYNSIETGVIFVFIDMNGFNEYVLVHSTKRGEIQDETWQQLLNPGEILR